MALSKEHFAAELARAAQQAQYKEVVTTTSGLVVPNKAMAQPEAALIVDPSVLKNNLTTAESLTDLPQDSLQSVAERTNSVLVQMGRNRFDVPEDDIHFLAEHTLSFLADAKRGFQGKNPGETDETFVRFHEAAEYTKVLFGRMQTVRFPHLDMADLEKDTLLVAPVSREEHIDRVSEMQKELVVMIESTTNKRLLPADRHAQYRTFAFFEAARAHNKETEAQEQTDWATKVLQDATRDLGKVKPELTPEEEAYRHSLYLNYLRDQVRDATIEALGIDLPTWQQEHQAELQATYQADPDDPKSTKSQRRFIAVEIQQIINDPALPFVQPTPDEKFEAIQTHQSEMEDAAADDVATLLGVEKPPVSPVVEGPRNYYDRKVFIAEKFEGLFGESLEAGQAELVAAELQKEAEEMIIFDMKWNAAEQDLARILGVDPKTLQE